MNRDLARLADSEFDVVIIGGGIYGACLAWDAALRGLSVALVERRDFGHATSANSLKIIHGGLRYLQDMDLNLIRQMVAERKAFMHIAPHLVHPLPCLMPTYGFATHGKPAMTAALTLNNIFNSFHNRLADPQKHLPHSRIISRSECLRMLPGIADQNITGGAVWYDGQIDNSERLTLSFILSAAHEGAAVANYVEAIGVQCRQGRISGIRARDCLTGDKFDVRAKMVVNAGGPWGNQLLRTSEQPDTRPVPMSVAFNLMAPKFIADVAAGLPSRYVSRNGAGTAHEKSQLLFVAPWRDYSLIGTKHIAFIPQNGDDGPGNYELGEDEIERFVQQLNSAYPAAQLSPEDVVRVFWGFLPAEPDNGRPDEVRLLRRSTIVDHEKDGRPGLISVVGVKYTTARYTAQKAIDLVIDKLGVEGHSDCRTHKARAYGGDIERFDDFMQQALAHRPDAISQDSFQHLVRMYGSRYGDILNYVETCPPWGQRLVDGGCEIEAQIVHAVRHEMAVRLDDVVYRRTELGAKMDVSPAVIERCARIMSDELGWREHQVQQEMDMVHTRALCR